MRETAPAASSIRAARGSAQRVSLSASDLPTPIREISTADEPRYSTGMGELDRVLGGGIVKGSLSLLGGDPDPGTFSV